MNSINSTNKSSSSSTSKFPKNVGPGYQQTPLNPGAALSSNNNNNNNNSNYHQREPSVAASLTTSFAGNPLHQPHNNPFETAVMPNFSKIPPPQSQHRLDHSGHDHATPVSPLVTPSFSKQTQPQQHQRPSSSSSPPLHVQQAKNFSTSNNSSTMNNFNSTSNDLAKSFHSFHEAEKRASKRSQKNVDIRNARIKELVDFFQTPQTEKAPLPTLVSFLTMRGYARSEMEDALEQIPSRSQEYGILLNWIPGTELTSIVAGRDDGCNLNNTLNYEDIIGTGKSNNNNNNNNNNSNKRKSVAQQQQQQQKNQDLDGNDDDDGDDTTKNNNKNTTSLIDPKLQQLTQYWRIGGTVYVYLGSMRYAPIPLEIVNLTRAGDILGIDVNNIRRFDPKVRKTLANPNAPLCCQGLNNLRYFAPGFKGVGTNHCVTADIVHVGLILLVADPQCEMGTFYEATVLAVHIDEESVAAIAASLKNKNNNSSMTAAPDMSFGELGRDIDSSDEDQSIAFTIDIELSLNGNIVKNVHPNDTRLFTHVEILRSELRYRRDQLRAARKGQKFSVDKVSSGASFPVSGAKLLDDTGDRASGNALRAIKLVKESHSRKIANNNSNSLSQNTHGISGGAAAASSVEYLSRGFVKNFTRYPDLISDESEPVHCRTAADFISYFGESKTGNEHDSKTRRFPIHPQCQRNKTGVAFGFDTSFYPRNGRSHIHLTVNPVVDIAFQCMKTNRKYIDPDFPPSFFSLFGCDDVTEMNLHDLPPFFTRKPEQLEDEVLWRRLSDVFFRPRMHVVDSSPAQLKLGPFTPPWLECVVLSLARNPDMVEEIISPGEDGWMFGAYVVRLLVEGQWHYVLVDDFVPCHPRTGQPLCFLTGKESEIYTAIIEKALAKVEGSYANLYKYLRPEVTPGRIWNDLSGYVHEVIEHDIIADKANICENLLGLVNEESLDVAPLHVQSKSYGDEVANLVEHGFDRDSWWHVDHAVRFWDPPNDPVYFFRVYRGENVSFPVSGKALQSAVFDGMDVSILNELPGVACDSSIYFWVDGTRFFEIFERTLVLRELRNSHKAFFEGSFTNRPNAGPPSNSGKFFSNPQIFLTLVQQADMIFHVELRDRRLSGGPNEPEPLSKEIEGEALQLYILQTHPVEEPITAQGFKNEPEIYKTVSFAQPARVSDDDDAKTYPCVTLRCNLPGGCFVLVPSLGQPAAEDFTVSIYSTASFQVSRLN